MVKLNKNIKCTYSKNMVLLINIPIVRKFSQKDTSHHDMFSSKESYILAKWKSDFPTYETLSYKDISNLSSRSRDIGIWFQKASEEFNLYKEAPDWFLNADKDASDWTKEVQDKYAYIKSLNKEYNVEINKISLESKRRMKELEVKHRTRLINELKDNPELVIELINSTMLPFEIHVKSYEFNTKDEARDFISNELRIFKERTYRKFVSGEMSKDELVDLLFVKQ
jgi:hypothetical protein